MRERTMGHAVASVAATVAAAANASSDERVLPSNAEVIVGRANKKLIVVLKRAREP